MVTYLFIFLLCFVYLFAIIHLILIWNSQNEVESHNPELNINSEEYLDDCFTGEF